MRDQQRQIHPGPLDFFLFFTHPYLPAPLFRGLSWFGEHHLSVSSRLFPLLRWPTFLNSFYFFKLFHRSALPFLSSHFFPHFFISFAQRTLSLSFVLLPLLNVPLSSFRVLSPPLPPSPFFLLTRPYLLSLCETAICPFHLFTLSYIRGAMFRTPPISCTSPRHFHSFCPPSYLFHFSVLDWLITWSLFPSHKPTLLICSPRFVTADFLFPPSLTLPSFFSPHFFFPPPPGSCAIHSPTPLGSFLFNPLHSISLYSPFSLPYRIPQMLQLFLQTSFFPPRSLFPGTHVYPPSPLQPLCVNQHQRISHALGVMDAQINLSIQYFFFLDLPSCTMQFVFKKVLFDTVPPLVILPSPLTSVSYPFLGVS